MRNTENLSLRLDPEVVRLARRTAQERRQTLRELFEEAIRRHVAAVTTPEERVNLLSAVEEILLRRLDERLRDALERIVALQAKEAIDQAQTLQIVKRVLGMQVQDNAKWKAAVNRAWEEAVERTRKRGRPFPPEAVEELEEKIAQWQRWAGEQEEALKRTQAALEAATAENNRLKEQIQRGEREAFHLRGQHEAQDFALQRELWVSEQLEKQGLNPLGRKTAAKLRRIYTERHRAKEAGL